MATCMEAPPSAPDLTGLRLPKRFTPLPVEYVRGRRWIDISGQRFGKLTARQHVGFSGRLTVWLCDCDCGKQYITYGSLLRFGRTTHCGCLNENEHHGQSHTEIYMVYRGMIARCGEHGHKDYAGRGITVCERWRESFERFLADMGPRPSPEHSIDRIDNNGNYEPGNCRWATRSQQARNTRCNRLLTYNGKTMTAVEWQEELGITRQRLYQRLDKMPVEEALSYRKGEQSPMDRRRIEANRIRAVRVAEANAAEKLRRIQDKSERKAAVDTSRLSHEARRERRRTMANMVRSGMSAEQVAAYFGVTTVTVRKSVNECA